MNRFLHFITDSRTLAACVILVIVGLSLLAWWLNPMGLLLLGLVVAAAVLTVLLVLLYRWLLRKIRASRAARGLDDMVASQADTQALRQRMREAVKAIKSSRIGLARGRTALYELPWYMIIGNPAAGKSTAIINSGLRFPFSDNRASVIRGIGGTRDCDWYFTTEGIVLDTAGRYSVNKEDRSSWLSFLGLLRKYRPRAPVNGILVAASIAELDGKRPEFAIDLAKSLRERVQEVVEQLGVFVPVYVIFTKADLIAGFNEFFQGLEAVERERVWGATLPFEPRDSSSAVDQFDQHFDVLAHGLREMGLGQMALRRGEDIPPAFLTLPLEFMAVKSSLRAFVSTLFEDNPYQFRPVFRGFYFTSAVQEGVSVKRACGRVAERFSLRQRAKEDGPGPETETSYFLQDLFRKVIFSDRGLVRQYSNPKRTRTRYVAFVGATLVLAVMLALWGRLYISNRALIDAVQTDFQHVVALQNDHVNLESRLQAALVLQNRLRQLMTYRTDHSFADDLGLNQDRQLERRVRNEYYNAMRQLLLVPVSTQLETYLAQAVEHADQLNINADARNDVSLSPNRASGVYDALKSYLMLGPGHEHVSVAHLRDQVPDFWRAWLQQNRGTMSREAVIEMARRLMSFYLRQATRPDWPAIDRSMTLVESTRGALREVMRGMPAIQRSYSRIMARAATRFPAVTVIGILDAGASTPGAAKPNNPVLVGSNAVPGEFTRKAWKTFVKPAIDDAANHELSNTDWVLDAATSTDLSVTRSPFAIKHLLARMYKQHYIAAWRQFLQHISITPFHGFQQAATVMDALGDPKTSPLNTLLQAVYEQTSWDHPAVSIATVSTVTSTGGDSGGWIDELLSDEVSAQTNERVKTAASTVANHSAVDRIARAFSGISRVVASRGKQPSVLGTYLEQLRAVGARLDSIAERGAPGRGTLKLMQQTLEGNGSEIARAAKFVEQQVLAGPHDDQLDALRTIFLQPLVQTYAALVPATGRELNRIWQERVYLPYEKRLSANYPFNRQADMQADPRAIATIFGSSGAIAAFGADDLGSLIIRRGNSLTPARWAGVGIRLSPQVVAGYGLWVSALNSPSQTTSGRSRQTTFQILPRASSRVKQYTIRIDGQRLRYRNTPPEWRTFVWPAAKGSPGVRIRATTIDGRGVTLLDEPGREGLTKLFQAGSPKRLGHDHFLLTWAKGDVEVSVKLRILNRPAGSDHASRLVGVKLPHKAAVMEATDDRASNRVSNRDPGGK